MYYVSLALVRFALLFHVISILIRYVRLSTFVTPVSVNGLQKGKNKNIVHSKFDKLEEKRDLLRQLRRQLEMKMEKDVFPSACFYFWGNQLSG